MLQHVKDSKGRSTGTKLDHLQSVEKMTKVTPPELELPEVDPSVMFLLNNFFKIKSQAGQNITYTELKSFQDVLCVDLQSWHCEVIMKIDSIFEGSVHG